ncbi:hypothetical protein CS542_05130 [Pedobacter sp. IW39]|nr:hypothetical protein CS542_05130 [Pedobacter sp. IW39]
MKGILFMQLRMDMFQNEVQNRIWPGYIPGTSNGYTSVYGHISRFAPKIAEAVKALQYQKRLLNWTNSCGRSISCTQGDVIAYSGNRGSSGGPHLHLKSGTLN